MKYDLPFPIFEEDGYRYNFHQYFSTGNEIDITYESLTDALQDITHEGFYYSYNIDIDGKKNQHMHAHSFEEVVKDLYKHPVSFSLNDKDKEYYSNQEIRYLNNVKNFLIGVGRKDTDKIKKEDCINELVEDYSKYFYIRLSKDVCEKIVEEKEYIRKYPTLIFGKMDEKPSIKVLIDDDYKFYARVTIDCLNLEKIDVNSVDLDKLSFTIDEKTDNLYIITEKITVNKLYK